MLTIEEQPPLAHATACRACGYLIAGLPPTGTCPECGGPYDRHELVLFGRRPGQAWRTGWPMIAPALIVAANLRGLTFGFNLLPVAFWSVGLVGGLTAVTARAMSVRPGSARLRLSRDGCGMDVEPPPPPLLAQAAAVGRSITGRRTAGPAWTPGGIIPWWQVRRVQITPARGGRWRVRVHRSGQTRGKSIPIDVLAEATPEQLEAVRAYARQCGAPVEG